MTAQEIFDQLLINRGIDDVSSFIKPSYEALADPYLVADMSNAVERIIKAHKNKEKIAIFGDYDIDGMTATSILSEALTKFGFAVEKFIPDRFLDGYGLSNRGIDELKLKKVELIITVDTGSLAHEQVDYAKTKKIDVIITDHHSLGKTLPKAVAVLNPKRKDSKYPYREMAGVGVAFTLIRALQSRMTGYEAGQEKWLLDLVALGTVCDVVPLTGENRVLVYYGLIVMSQTNRVGLQALATVSDIELSEIDPQALGWRFGPRLNASGRLTHAQLSMDLLNSNNLKDADKFALELDEINNQRRSIQKQIYLQAEMMAESQIDNSVLVLASVGWNHGVVGIVASKISEKFAKPTFVIEVDGDTAKGSARSFGDFSLSDAIASASKLIEKGGGHSAAAGVTLKTDKIDKFREAINKYYKSLKLTNQLDYLIQQPDIELTDFEGLDDELMELINQLEPFGEGHKQPIFKVSGITVSDWRPVGADKSHAKATFVDSSGVIMDGIGFGLAEKMPIPGSKLAIVFSLEYNIWNGHKTIQQVVKEIEA